MGRPASDVAFTDAVKKVQSERGSRSLYARVEREGGFETEVDDRLRALLADVDTAFLATASKDGQPYVQHRGGPPGFIHAIDATTLAFADYAGNRQYVSTGNLSENDRVCLIALDYARRRRVKIWGTARVVGATPEWIARLAPAGRRVRVEQIVILTVNAWDVNCPQHIPQKVDAEDVARTIEALEARIERLERENEALRARAK